MGWMRVSALVAAVAVGGLVGTSAAAVPGRSPAPVETLHRVVWDVPHGDVEVRGSLPTLDLRSAEVDGSDERSLLRHDTARLHDLALDPAGRRAALLVSGWSGRGHRPTVVVVEVLTGAHRAVRGLRAVDGFVGVEWSPDGRRLLIVGQDRLAHGRRSALWSVRPDGSHLRRLLVREHRPILRGDAVWTRRGVVVSDGRGLLLLRHGRLRMLAVDGYQPQVSGDRTWLYFVRERDGRAELRRMRPDARRQELVVPDVRDTPERGFLQTWAPDHSGGLLLSRFYGPERVSGDPLTYVVHPGEREPLLSDPVLDFLGGPILVDWN